MKRFWNNVLALGLSLFLAAGVIMALIYMISPLMVNRAPAEGSVLYICSMHPNVQQSVPGICPVCGMPLVEMIQGSGGLIPAPPLATITARVQLTSRPAKGASVSAVLKLSKPDGSPVTFADLKVTHTKRIHLLIVDDSLSDYTHVHPVETSTPGEYAFTFEPKFGGVYNFFADLLPVATGRQEYARASATILGDPAPPYRWVNLSSRVDGYWFHLQTDRDQGFVVGEPISLHVTVTDSKGFGITTLEPLMAAFAHGVAFSSDLSSVIHVHPIGAIPGENDRGGPSLEFKMVPRQAGYSKFYVQVQVNHQNLYASFGIKVRSSGTTPQYVPVPACD